ncbi:unnamed protein product [Eruca vesicaria subsp. sativa]|uniref:RNase H type-1 domain-containing protein n=1 Tax=Eruca vesicaria subsp. sativa TaxID=29727 RepID=A0ABC8M1F5_ERUVS|nr:unnamed protein product [Eruca vesicaria subsp. sativa]
MVITGRSCPSFNKAATIIFNLCITQANIEVDNIICMWEWKEKNLVLQHVLILIENSFGGRGDYPYDQAKTRLEYSEKCREIIILCPLPLRGISIGSEALDIREAVFKCKELRIQRLRCETDSIQLVKAITTRSPSPEIYGIVSDIAVVSDSEVVQFKWIPREKNKDPDALAKQALLLESNI